MATIVWVEDQKHWVDRFGPSLQDSNFDGNQNRLVLLDSPDAVAGYLRDAREEPDLALLDARMRGDDQAGFKVARHLHQRWPMLPVIYFSEHSGTRVEAQAFELQSTGDFIAKHQRNAEQVLCWRIKALLRQRLLRTARAHTDCLNSGPLTIDLLSWEIYWRDTRLQNPKNPKRPLPPTPRRVLHHLVLHAPRPQNAAQVAHALDLDEQRFTNAAYRQHIRTLRDALQLASDGEFSTLAELGQGLVTCSDSGAYHWVAPELTER